MTQIQVAIHEPWDRQDGIFNCSRIAGTHVDIAQHGFNHGRIPHLFRHETHNNYPRMTWWQRKRAFLKSLFTQQRQFIIVYLPEPGDSIVTSREFCCWSRVSNIDHVIKTAGGNWSCFLVGYSILQQLIESVYSMIARHLHLSIASPSIMRV